MDQNENVNPFVGRVKVKHDNERYGSGKLTITVNASDLLGVDPVLSLYFPPNDYHSIYGSFRLIEAAMEQMLAKVYEGLEFVTEEVSPNPIHNTGEDHTPISDHEIRSTAVMTLAPSRLAIYEEPLGFNKVTDEGGEYTFNLRDVQSVCLTEQTLYFSKVSNNPPRYSVDRADSPMLRIVASSPSYWRNLCVYLQPGLPLTIEVQSVNELVDKGLPLFFGLVRFCRMNNIPLELSIDPDVLIPVKHSPREIVYIYKALKKYAKEPRIGTPEEIEVAIENARNAYFSGRNDYYNERDASNASAALGNSRQYPTAV